MKANGAGERLPLTAFIICQNEEGYLENCIRSLAVCADIVIVDSGSTDGTEGLVRRYQEAGWPIRFLRQKWLGYSGQKQFAMDQARHSWCLNIDADERLDEDLQQALPQLLDAPSEVSGWRLPFRLYLIGYGYTPKFVFNRPLLRLVRREKAHYDLKVKVHEGLAVRGEIKVAPRGGLLHYRPLPIEDQILKENQYAGLKASQVLERGKGPRYGRLIFNPLIYFLRLYFRRRLCFCGFAGFIQAMTGSIYSFLMEATVYQRHALHRQPPRDTSGEKD
jgi:glycosyltransferase involved in cell wall biosynthesis